MVKTVRLTGKQKTDFDERELKMVRLVMEVTRMDKIRFEYISETKTASGKE